MTRKLSNWSKPGEKPPMVGVWLTDYGTRYQYWDGRRWRCAMDSPRAAFNARGIESGCDQPTVRFRGLATKPENDDAI